MHIQLWLNLTFIRLIFLSRFECSIVDRIKIKGENLFEDNEKLFKEH